MVVDPRAISCPFGFPPNPPYDKPAIQWEGTAVTNLERCYNIFDLREAARRRLPRGMFEYIDRGTEDEVALADNREAFRRIKLRTRFLMDLSDRDLGTDIFGARTSLPIAIAPTGIAGLLWYQGELELAKAAAAAGIPFSLSVGALTSMETIAREAGGRLWFQFYPWQDEDATYEMIGRARDLDFEGLIVTIDGGLGRAREYNEHNGFAFPFRPNIRALSDMAMHPRWLTGVIARYLLTEGLPRNANYPARYHASLVKTKKRVAPKYHESMTWEYIDRVRDFWPRKLIVKSILSGEEARIAVDHGADAIVVSNHGGRALDSAVTPIEILPEIVAAVGGKTTIILDSGIRRGSDVVKALARGADLVLVGRATLYGVASGGQAGAAKAIRLLSGELERTFGYIGVRRVSELGSQVFAPHVPSG